MDEEKKRIVEIEKEIQILKDKLKPDKIAKLIDSSHLSINNLRGFLQILSIIMSVFLAGAIAFGLIGVNNILELNNEVSKIKEVKDNFNSLHDEALKEFTAQFDSLNDIKSSFKKIHNEMIILQDNSEHNLSYIQMLWIDV